MIIPDTHNKLFVEEDTLIQDAYRLALSIYQSDFKPDYIVGIWPGGSTIGIYVHECLQYLGLNADHTVIKTSYRGLNDYLHQLHSNQAIAVSGFEYLLEKLKVNDRILIVDNVMSTGRHMRAALDHIKDNGKAANSKVSISDNIKVACVYNKPLQRLAEIQPDFFIHSTNRWIVFPYELTGLSTQELTANKPWAKAFLLE